MIKIEDLFYNCVILYSYSIHNSELTKTKLLSLAYLMEYEYYRQFRERLTDTEWVCFQYGPGISDYDNILKDLPLKIKDQGLFEVVELEDVYTYAVYTVTDKIKCALNNVIYLYGRKSLDELLDFICYDTEPMLNVYGVTDVLKFDTISPVNERLINTLSSKQIKVILNKLKNKLKSAKSI
jgi:uncharacterized phage-associated protein